MADAKTYQQVEDMVLQAVEAEDETSVTTGASSEMMNYCNRALKRASSIINRLNEDYFLVPGTAISFVSGTQDYTIPTDMYADKMRKLIYANGADIYEVPFKKRKSQFVDIAIANLYPGTQRYSAKLLRLLTGEKLRIYPTPQETVASVLTPWYIREIAEITAVSDTVDIPEFYSYIIAFMKVMYMKKEGHPLLEDAKQELKEEHQEMVESLSNRIPDEEDAIEMDMSFYEEHN
jgi:hypothetical protein